MSTGNSQWQLERDATRSFLDLQEQAEKTRDAYEKAKMQLPEPLRRFLGLGVIEVKANAPIMPPPPYPRPPVTGDDWIWVPLADVMPITALAAVLRDEVHPLRAREVIEKVTALLPSVSAGSIANLFSKREGVTIKRSPDGGWVVMNRETTPILHEGRMWGKAEWFQQYEVAAYRRDVIQYLLGQFTSGFQIVQIVDQLRKLPWLRAPFTKDVVKTDMNDMFNRGLVRHRGNSKKWELVPMREREEAAKVETPRMLNF